MFKDNDPQARVAMLSYLERKNIRAIENPNQFDIDILDLDRGRAYELERRGKWKTGEYPYRMVNILERKIHLFQGEHEFNNYYVIFNFDCTNCIFISSTDIQPYLIPEDIYLEDCTLPDGTKRKDWVYKIPREVFTMVNVSNN